jgi:hypothetical protein
MARVLGMNTVMKQLCSKIEYVRCFDSQLKPKRRWIIHYSQSVISNCVGDDWVVDRIGGVKSK